MWLSARMRTRRNWCWGLLAIAGWFVPLSDTVRAEDHGAAAIKLRGGFDLNPALVPGGDGAPLIGFDLAAAGVRQRGESGSALALASSTTAYTSDVEASQSHKLEWKLARVDGGAGFAATSRIGYDRADDLRAFEAAERLRGEWGSAHLRPFMTGELRYATLNEPNLLAPGFLPDGHESVRFSAIPGIAFRRGELELGISANLARTRYTDRFDDYGVARDNDRTEPFLFAAIDSAEFDLFASVSRLQARWRDPLLVPVDETLFDLSVSYEAAPVSLLLGARRLVADTTFPVSPVALATVLEAQASIALARRVSATLSAQHVRADYLGTPLTTRFLTYGAGIAWQATDAVTLGADVSRIRASSLIGEEIEGLTAYLSVTRTLDLTGAKRVRAAAAPPPAGPRIRPLLPTRTRP